MGLSGHEFVWFTFPILKRQQGGFFFSSLSLSLRLLEKKRFSAGGKIVFMFFRQFSFILSLFHAPLPPGGVSKPTTVPGERQDRILRRGRLYLEISPVCFGADLLSLLTCSLCSFLFEGPSWIASRAMNKRMDVLHGRGEIEEGGLMDGSSDGGFRSADFF